MFDLERDSSPPSGHPSSRAQSARRGKVGTAMMRTAMAVLCISNVASMALADLDVYKEINEKLSTTEAQEIMNGFVLTVRNGSIFRRSTEYQWGDFMKAYSQITGDPDANTLAGRQFLNGGSAKAGIVNIALFIAQSLHESIQYDACDENNYSADVPGIPDYPISSACGQNGQDYTKYTCFGPEGPNNRNVECPVDLDMQIQARTNALWGGSPPPLFCAPRSETGGGTPRWDSTPNCVGKPTGTIPIPEFPQPYLEDALQKGTGELLCNAYTGQSVGKFTSEGCDAEIGCPNAVTIDTQGGTVHTDVEGCCWWGRGVIQTTGPCNTGRFNYYLTGTYYDENGLPQKEKEGNYPYPDLNLCTDPGLICNGPGELKWTSGLFFWLFSVEGYSNPTNYDYDHELLLEELGEAIFDYPPSGRDFVDLVSGLINRGCPAVECPAGPVLALEDRYKNFIKTMEALKHVYDPSTYPKPAGEPAGPYLGPWFSPQVLCEPCKDMPNADCGLTWYQTNSPVCVGWAQSPENCAASGGVATAWCAGVDFSDQPSQAPVATKAPATTPPTDAPVNADSAMPTNADTHAPTNADSAMPTNADTQTPTNADSAMPTNADTHTPTNADSAMPTNTDTHAPTNADSAIPTNADTHTPTNADSAMPTNADTHLPTMATASPSFADIPIKDFGDPPKESDFPLSLCEGDCDANDDCEAGLVCFQRGANQPVPGCIGAPSSRTDFCVPPSKIPDADLPIKDYGGSPDIILGRCEGDCDSDSDCKPGLRCYQRSKGQSIPGCYGELGSNSDFCIPKTDTTAPVTMPTSSPNSSKPKRMQIVDYGSTPKPEDLPLERCAGDCDNHTQCADGLECFQRDAGKPVPGCDGPLGSNSDFCVIPGLTDDDYEDSRRNRLRH